jgi:hypothetical protein
MSEMAQMRVTPDGQLTAANWPVDGWMNVCLAPNEAAEI